jgi:hypothetical protein
MAQPTQEMVDEALRIATKENGYSLKDIGMNAQAIAIDLCDCYGWDDDVDITNLDLEHVIKLVEDWIKRHPEEI